MTCLKDIKKLTKKKVLDLQPIYYVKIGISDNIYNLSTSIIKLEGEQLKKALKNYWLYDIDRAFTSKEEAENYIYYNTGKLCGFIMYQEG